MILKQKALIFFISLSSLLTAQTAFNRYYNEAIEAFEARNFKLAVEKFGSALDNQREVKNNYRIADAYMYRGYCRYLLEHYKSAHDDVDKAIALKPEYARPYYFKTLAFLGEKKYDEAITWCDKALTYKEDDADILGNKSKALYCQKKYKESNGPLFLILKSDSRNIAAMRYIGANYNSLKLYDSSVVYFSMAIQVDPLDFMSYYDRGIAQSYLKDYEAARLDIEKAMQLDTSTKQIGYNNLGFFLKLEQGDYQGSLEYFNKAIEIDDKFAYAYSNRGFAKLKTGDIKGAYKDVEKSIKLDNTNAYAYKNLALVYLADGKKDKACEALNKSIALGYTGEYDDEAEKLLKENCK